MQRQFTMTSQAVLEALERRALDFGDEFSVTRDKVTVRCLAPEKHQNRDSHPSAIYTVGKYLTCPVCQLKLGEWKLAEMLGIDGGMEGGLTLIALADAKKLPMSLVREWGWVTKKTKDSRAAVLVPWHSSSGGGLRVLGYHVRHYVNKDDGSGPRFTWALPKGSVLDLYGAWRIPSWIEEAETRGIKPYVWLTESEADALTLVHHGVPALAYGGTGFWRVEWAKALTPFARVLIVQEPDTAGRGAARRIALDIQQAMGTSTEVLVVPFSAETKDANGLHLAVNADTAVFTEKLRALVAQAIPAAVVASEVAQVAAEEAQRQRIGLEAIAGPLLRDPRLLHLALHVIEARGVTGKRQNALLVRLQVRSRALPRPVNLEVGGPTSTGKSHQVLGVLALEDPTAYYELTALSQKALVYTAEDFVHRILYLQEPEAIGEEVGGAIIRSVAWDGRLKYDTVAIVEGMPTGAHIEKPGPTGLIVTTTKPLEEQIAARMLRIEADSSQEQTRRVLRVIAESVNGSKPAIDLEPWHALSKLLGLPADVSVAFAPFLAEKVTVRSPRMRRDFHHLLTLVQSCALEHQYQRQRLSDGRLMATLADYAMVRVLVLEAFLAAQAEGVTKTDRTMVGVVQQLSTQDASESRRSVSQAEICAAMKLSKSVVSNRVRRLIHLGFLQNLEDSKGKAARLVLGAPLPEEAPDLPEPEEVAAWLRENGHGDLVTGWVDPLTGVWCGDTLENDGPGPSPERTPERCSWC